MNLLFPQILSKRFLQSGRRVARVLPMLLCLLVSSAVPAFADPVKMYQVIQTHSSSTGAPDLKLNTLVSQQDPATAKNSTPNGPGKDGTQAPKTDSVIPGVTVTGQSQQLGVELIQEAEVEGTICDCGEIFIAGGGIPKWPFLFLAAVPLIFIDHGEENPTPTPTPTPTVTPTPPPPPPSPPPPPQVPEPASLLLLGTGLAAFGAGLRRRYSRHYSTPKTVQQTEEEE
jgi:PEP-CTERM motif